MPPNVKDAPSKTKVPSVIAMMLGGMSGMVATTVVHPLDLVKVRLQLYPKHATTRDMFRNTIKCRGYMALYTGLSAGLLRQVTYTTIRVGVYHGLLNVYHNKYVKDPTLYEKLMIGVTAGIIGALAGNPSEVALVRVMADGPLEPCANHTKMRIYKGAFQALKKIRKEEGILALWRGGRLTLGRSILLSITQVWSYSQVREIFRERNLAKGLSLHIYTSFISSFLAAVVSLPIDLVKTRYQVEQGGVTQAGIFHEIVQRKGIMYFWKGFVPYYFRMSIHTVVSLLMFEKLYQIYEAIEKNEK